jgi:hypothetical protein
MDVVGSSEKSVNVCQIPRRRRIKFFSKTNETSGNVTNRTTCIVVSKKNQICQKFSSLYQFQRL